MKAVWIFLFGVLLQATSEATIKVKVHFSPITNLVYQLDCISGELQHCSRSAYEDVWAKNFTKGAEDQALIKNWGELMKRYRPALEIEDPNSAVSSRFEGVKLSTKIRIASFQSSTMEDYFSRLDLVIVPKDREKFETIIRTFYPRFDKWWKATALPKGKNFAKMTESLLLKKEIATKIRQFAHFYAAELPENYLVHMNLFYRPDADGSTAGQQVENYSVAEFLPDEKPADRLDVIIHELCHFFYRNSTNENFANLEKRFEDSGNLEARAASNLLNETLATTLGNGIINKLTMKKERWAKYVARENSFYNSYSIDKSSKAILPWIEKWVEEGRTLYDLQFVPEYVTSLEKALRAELTAPQTVLNQLVLIADDKYGANFENTIHKTFRASSMYTSEGEWSDERLLMDYHKHKSLSALLVVHPTNLHQLKENNILMKDDFERLKSHIKKNGQAILSFKRNATAVGYVIVARDFEQAKTLVEKLSLVKTGFNGVYEGP